VYVQPALVYCAPEVASLSPFLPAAVLWFRSAAIHGYVVIENAA
jgi:hypothetical protein